MSMRGVKVNRTELEVHVGLDSEVEVETLL